MQASEKPLLWVLLCFLFKWHSEQLPCAWKSLWVYEGWSFSDSWNPQLPDDFYQSKSVLVLFADSIPWQRPMMPLMKQVMLFDMLWFQQREQRLCLSLAFPCSECVLCSSCHHQMSKTPPEKLLKALQALKYLLILNNWCEANVCFIGLFLELLNLAHARVTHQNMSKWFCMTVCMTWTDQTAQINN